MPGVVGHAGGIASKEESGRCRPESRRCRPENGRCCPENGRCCPWGRRCPPGPPLPGGVCGGGPGREGGVGQPAVSAVLMASAIGALEAGFWPVKRLASWTVKAW